MHHGDLYLSMGVHCWRGAAIAGHVQQLLRALSSQSWTIWLGGALLAWYSCRWSCATAPARTQQTIGDMSLPRG